MDRELVAKQLRDVADALEMGCTTSIESFVERVLSITRKSDMKGVVGEFIHQIKAHEGEKALAEWLHDNGYAKVGGDVPVDTVVSAISTMDECAMKWTCNKLVDLLINHDSNVNSAFFEALGEHEVYEEGSEQFEEAAKEWAEDNDYIKLDDWSFDDLADRYDRSTVRDFVVEYIEQNL